MSSVGPDKVRLSELVATISMGTDLGLGQPMEHVIRQTIIALRMAEHLGLEVADRTVVYYSGLLAWVGCHTDAYEQAKWFGDDIAVKREAFKYDTGKPGPMAAFAIRSVGADRSLFQRARLWAALPIALHAGAAVELKTHWIGADHLAQQLDLGDAVRHSLKDSYERWDGRGPFGIRGDEIGLPSRLVQLADVVVAFLDMGGLEAAVAVARRRSGTQFDPVLVDLFCANAEELTHHVDDTDNWAAIVGAEPQLRSAVSEQQLDRALEAIGDFADVKSPFTIGHSRAVAELAADAARCSGMPEANVTRIRRAGLLHDIGRLGVSNAVWDKPGRLTPAEMERVRLHPYLTERMLAATPALAELGRIAVQHHERLDGSGYPRGLSGHSITPAGHLLGTADYYSTMLEPRPHRPALVREDAGRRLQDAVRDGRIDADAAHAVLQAAGSRADGRGRGRGTIRHDWPAGLTDREVEVLRLLAIGRSNTEIAALLHISKRTAGTHIEHIYTKIGATNRATAALFAMQHHLMLDD